MIGKNAIRALALSSCLLAVPALAQSVNLYTTREPSLLNPVLEAFTKDTGVKVNAVSAEELKRIQDKLKPVTAKFAPQIGEDFLKEFNAEIEKARAAK